MADDLVLLPQLSGNGYYSYSPTANQYGTRQTVDTLIQIARDHFRNQRVQIGIGDMSLQSGGAMPNHRSHKDGKCADIRPLRTDGRNTPVTIHQSDYDRVSTELLIQALNAHVNVDVVLFNDSTIKGVRYWAGHDNHLHVKFKK